MLLVLSAYLGATANVLEQAALGETLALDTECAVEDERCALSALQRRSERQVENALQRRSGRMLEAAAANEGSCKRFGCVEYTPHNSCQCNADCTKHRNCCADYRQTCAVPVGSCQVYGCKGFNATQSCQCNDQCEKFGNCCHDFKEECGPHGPPGFVPSCRFYGCGGDYVAHHACQCTDECSAFGNCCKDYAQTCQRPPVSAQSCTIHDCGTYDPNRHCQCNDECTQRGNCCSDYRKVCQQERPGEGKVHGHPAHGKQYPARDGFTLTLVEEFDKPLDLEKDDIWTWSDGGLSEGQVRFVRQGIIFESGKMKLRVSDRSHGDAQRCSHAEVGFIPGKRLTSGELRTKHNNFRYGYYEASIRAPHVKPGDSNINGNFVAAFFLFRDGKFKHWREIDIEVTGDAPDSLHTNMLSGDNQAEWKLDMSDEDEHNVSKNLRADFHTYGIEWLPHRIRWFLDGEVVRESDGTKVPIPTLSTKIVLNLWIFSDLAKFGGKEIHNNHYPLEAECDWIRFYKWNGEDTYPCADLGTTCLTEDDWYLTSNNPCDRIRQTGTAFGQNPCHADCRL